MSSSALQKAKYSLTDSSPKKVSSLIPLIDDDYQQYIEEKTNIINNLVVSINALSNKKLETYSKDYISDTHGGEGYDLDVSNLRKELRTLIQKKSLGKSKKKSNGKSNGKSKGKSKSKSSDKKKTTRKKVQVTSRMMSMIV